MLQLCKDRTPSAQLPGACEEGRSWSNRCSGEGGSNDHVAAGLAWPAEAACKTASAGQPVANSVAIIHVVLEEESGVQQLQTTTALIDSGASSNVIYMAEVDKLGVAIERDTDKRIEGVTGDAEVLGTINLKFNIEGLEGTYEAEYWVIAGVRDPPLIIGLPFMGKHEMELRRGVGGRYALWRPGEEALREARREASEKLVKARRLRDCIAMLNEEGIAVGTKQDANRGTGWHNQPGGMAKNRMWRKETSSSETKEESEQQSEKESEEEPG